jgi:hypothetical protein
MGNIQHLTFNTEPRNMSKTACQWKQDHDNGSWDTSCDNKFEFTNDGPKENEFSFCPYCGGELQIKPTEAGGTGTGAEVKQQTRKAEQQLRPTNKIK